MQFLGGEVNVNKRVVFIKMTVFSRVSLSDSYAKMYIMLLLKS